MTEKSIKLSFLDVVEIALLALILNLNAIKIVARLNENVMVLGLFAVFATVVLLNKIQNNGLNFHFDHTLLLVLAVFVITAIVSMVFTGADGVFSLIKFLAGIVIAYLTSQMSWVNRMYGLKIGVILTLFYSLFLITRYSWVYATYTSGTTGTSNYLTVTLPVGLGLSLALVLLTMTKTTVLEKIAYTAAVVAHIVALTQYPARGNFIFPIILTAILLIYKNRKKPKLLFLSIIFIIVLAVGLYWIMTTFGNSYLQYRLTKMFESQEQEQRVPLYGYYIGYILDHLSFLIGQGFKNAGDILAQGGFHEHYPHNFVLEIVGEMGVVGIALLAVVGYKIIMGEYKQIEYFKTLDVEDRQKQEGWFFAANAGLLFYLMTFFKSYSIYDGYQLFIFMAFIIHSDVAINESNPVQEEV